MYALRTDIPVIVQCWENMDVEIEQAENLDYVV